VAASLHGAGRAVNACSQALELRASADHFDAIALPRIEATVLSLAKALAP
jgi:hypothetical protein